MLVLVLVLVLVLMLVLVFNSRWWRSKGHNAVRVAVPRYTDERQVSGHSKGPSVGMVPSKCQSALGPLTSCHARTYMSDLESVGILI